MKFGAMTSIENAPALKSAGWDFVEGNAQQVLAGISSDEQWRGAEIAKSCALPIQSVAILIPGELRITGPDVDEAKQRKYVQTICRRAQALGINTFSFGSGGSRNVPDGFDRAAAVTQVVQFGQMLADEAVQKGIRIAMEPLNRKECNFGNTLAEIASIVLSVRRENFGLLLDSYHFWMENESDAEIRRYAPLIKHVHLADRDGRVAPGESGASDYRALFEALRSVDYDGLITVEAPNWNPAPTDAARVLEFLKRQINGV